jgi:predicted LPLAT superfamily acyltransferase
MVSMLALSTLDHEFELRSGQNNDYEIDICCFSAKYAALRRKSKDWLARNQKHFPHWSDMSTCRLLFQWASAIKIQLSMMI